VRAARLRQRLIRLGKTGQAQLLEVAFQQQFLLHARTPLSTSWS
jgi:hypothetical protein